MSDSGGSEHQQLPICVVQVRMERRGKETVGVHHAGNVRVIEGVRIPLLQKVTVFGKGFQTGPFAPDVAKFSRVRRIQFGDTINLTGGEHGGHYQRV